MVEMDAAEQDIYETLRKDLLIPLEDGDIDAANAAALTGKLLQMANGAVYDENGKARNIHDRKLEKLEDLIEAANGQPVLIAYTVVTGDSLWRIAQNKLGNGTRYPEIKALNGMTSNTIYTGQKLLIP